MFLELVAIVVDDYDAAIGFFVGALGFELAEDSPALTNDGRPKRWVVVRPPGARTGILLARADGDEQSAAVGRQFAGRVGLFLRVDDFDAAYARMRAGKAGGQRVVRLDTGRAVEAQAPRRPAVEVDEQQPDVRVHAQVADRQVRAVAVVVGERDGVL